MAAVENFVTAVRERELNIPIVFGVFFYRSANPKTLQTLSDFFPVPAEGLTRDFERLTAQEVLQRTITELRNVGVDHVYVSNFTPATAPKQYRRLMTALG